ncbi:MAG: hypothetical protein RLZZ420_1295 [Bacteroidota bacterium]|jgi:hypothetical protein
MGRSSERPIFVNITGIKHTLNVIDYFVLKF